MANPFKPHGRNKPGTRLPPMRPITNEEVLAWARRHDLACWDNINEARAAFEDAQTLHLTSGVTPCDGGKNG